MIEKLEVLKNSFKDQFIKLISKFNDNRDIYFLKDNEDSRFWFLKKLQHEYVAVSWTETLIEIKFNNDLIIKNFIKNPNSDINFSKNYFRRMANHEYGHTISYKSVFYSLFPKDTRHLILNKNLLDITEKDIEQCFNSSNSEFVKLLKLKNVDIALIQMNFVEFWANLRVYEKIDNSLPEEFLNKRLKDLSTKDFLSHPVLCDPTVKFNYNIFLLLGYTGEFFIFGKWNDLINIFTSRNLNKLLDFYRFINSFFSKIIELNDDFDSMREDLIELVKFLDKIDYNKLVLHNKIYPKTRLSLIFFIKHLKQK